jgi:hypothetical protein
MMMLASYRFSMVSKESPKMVKLAKKQAGTCHELIADKW